MIHVFGIFLQHKSLNIYLMKKIIVLSRISTSSQHLESQTQELITAAERLGYSKSQQIIIEGIESAIKLSEEERETLNKMKYYIEKDNEVDCVICWEPSRLSRQQKTLYSIRDYLIERKIQLYILNPYMKLLNDERTQMDSTANIVFSLFATISENEMMIKKERFIRAKNELTKQGKKSAGSVIFGYMKDKDKYCVPHPYHSKIIIDLFTYYSENEVSLFETYKYASRKYPELFPMMDYIKSQHKISHFFNTEYYYKGNWCYPPLISEELYNKVHEKMKNAQCKPRYNSKLNYLGRGKVRCSHCGNIMSGIGGNVKAYCCCTDKNHSLQMNIEMLDWLIWEEVKVVVNMMSMVDNSTRIREIDNQIKERKIEKLQIEQYINDLNIKLEKLLALYLDSKIDNTRYNNKYEEFNNDLELKTKELSNIDIQINELENTLKNDDIEVKPVVVDDINSFEVKMEYVRKYLKDVILTRTEDRKISIEFTWKVPVITIPSRYEYVSKGGRMKIYRINEDETIDLIRK